MSPDGSKDKDSQEEYLNEVSKIRQSSAESFDRLMVYLSSGALVLSIGFLKDIVDTNKIEDFTLLLWSWGLFVASLLAVLLSHKSSQVAMDQELAGKQDDSDDWDVLTKFLNVCSFLALFAGIILFIIFVQANLQKETLRMGKEKKDLTEGVIKPPRPLPLDESGKDQTQTPKEKKD